MADFRFCGRVWSLDADLGFLTLVAAFVFWTLVADFGFWPLATDSR